MQRETARQKWQIASLLSPAYLWLTIAIFLPLSAMFYFSFLSATPVGNKTVTFTLKHYSAFFTKEIYWYNAWRSAKLGLQVTFICLVVAWPAAFTLARLVKGRAREAIFLLVILPFWSNALVRTFSWTMVLREPFDLLYTYPAIVIGLVHAYLPYAILTIYVSLQSIDERVIESARSLGANVWQTFRRIVLPLSLPGILAAIFLIFVPVMGSFVEPRILGGKEAIMLGPIIESQFTTAFNWPLGSALSFIMLGMVLLCLAVGTPFMRAMQGQSQ